MASLVRVLTPRFWENVCVDIFARAACEHTCACICVHTCGPCPACACTCVQNGVGVWSAGPAPALLSATRPRVEGGTQSLQGLSLPRAPSGPPEPTCRILWDPPTHTGASGGSQSGAGRLGPLGLHATAEQMAPQRQACLAGHGLRCRHCCQGSQEGGGQGTRGSALRPAGLGGAAARVFQVPAGTSAGLKGVLLPTQAAAPAAGPPPSWASGCHEGGGAALPSSPPSPGSQQPPA